MSTSSQDLPTIPARNRLSRALVGACYQESEASSLIEDFRSEVLASAAASLKALGHTDAAALLADVAAIVALPPQLAARRPVDPRSKAARLAWLIAEKFPKDAMTEPVDGETLTVYVTPASLGDWDWWLGRFHIPAGETTHRGSYSTAKGNHGSVKVLLTGHGVPALYSAEVAGGAR